MKHISVVNENSAFNRRRCNRPTISRTRCKRAQEV